MLTMTTDTSIYLLALCFMCVSSNDEQYFEHFCEDSDVCETNTLSAPLGSSVLLPCNFSTSCLNWVSWVHSPQMDLVHLTSEGRVKFMDPRNGRVKVFPNQGSEGNYSICIDELENSDLGCYQCTQGRHCLQVEVVADIGTWSETMLLQIYICAGVAFILLIVCTLCCMKCIPCCSNRTRDDSNNPVGAENDFQGQDNQQSSPTNQCSLPAGLDMTQPPQSTSGIYPSLNQINCEQIDSQRRKQRFHTELFSRLRQASLSRHYYVNQGDLSKQEAENHRRDRE